MKKKVQGKIEWLEFDLLQAFPEVSHGVFLRGDHFNLGEQGKIADQLRALRILGFKQGVKLAPQVHGKELWVIEETKNMLAVKKGRDGLITKCKQVGLMIRHADCQAAIFYDPATTSLAVVHCGWRGNVHNIYENTVAMMKKNYQVKPKDLRVCIGPSLGPKAAEFKHYRKELPMHFWQDRVAPTYFDLWEISRKQLLAAGVLKNHIEVAETCTYSSSQSFFSYRRDPKNPGRHATIAGLNYRAFQNVGMLG
ncbi:MAG: peptidoglycan editing factor PgeF [Chlamydiota bacterium]